MIKQIQRREKRPRFYVFKSNKHIYAQIIDDFKHKILCSSSSISIDLKSRIQSNTNCEIAYLVGENIAQKAINIGIKQVVFDRGNRKYHGQIKSLAQGARQVGIRF